MQGVTLIPCFKPHDFEAFYLEPMPDDDYPGREATIARADATCVKIFRSFVGKPLGRSTLDIAYLFPTDTNWVAGDRTITCLVGEPGEKTTGSLKGTRR